MNRWEVFAANGVPIFTVPFRWLARLISRRSGLDYARTGEGWL